MKWRLLALAACVALAACAEITVPEPLGEVPGVLEPDEWEGHWMTDLEAVILLTVVDRQGGVIEMSSMHKARATEGPPHAELRTEKIFLRRTGTGGLLVGSARAEKAGYVFFVVRKQGEHMTVWLPNASCIRILVERGALVGSMSDGDIALERLDPSMAVTPGSAECDIFDRDTHYELRRLGKK